MDHNTNVVNNDSLGVNDTNSDNDTICIGDYEDPQTQETEYNNMFNVDEIIRRK